MHTIAQKNCSTGTRFIMWGAVTAIAAGAVGAGTSLASLYLLLAYAPALSVFLDLGYAAAMCLGMPFAGGLLCVGIALRTLNRPIAVSVESSDTAHEGL